MAEERRSARRAEISGVRVTYEGAALDRVEAHALNVGTGGLFVLTRSPLGVGKRIALDIHVSGESEPWSALGRVVWVRPERDGERRPAGMGVKLIDVDDAVVAAIDRLVSHRERTERGIGTSHGVPSREPTAHGTGPSPQAVTARPIVAASPLRERTLLGVGLSPVPPAAAHPASEPPKGTFPPPPPRASRPPQGRPAESLRPLSPSPEPRDPASEAPIAKDIGAAREPTATRAASVALGSGAADEPDVKPHENVPLEPSEPDEPTPSLEPPVGHEANVRREPSVVIDLVAAEEAPPRTPAFQPARTSEPPPQPRKRRGAQRVILLLLLVAAAGATYAILEGDADGLLRYLQGTLSGTPAAPTAATASASVPVVAVPPSIPTSAPATSTRTNVAPSASSTRAAAPPAAPSASTAPSPTPGRPAAPAGPPPAARGGTGPAPASSAPAGPKKPANEDNPY